MIASDRNAGLSLANFSFVRAVLLAPALLAANPALSAVTRDTLAPPGSTPLYSDFNGTFMRPGQDLDGSAAAILQTVQPGQSGLTATFKIDATVRALRPGRTTSTYAVPADFSPSGQFNRNPLNISVRWWDAALFNPNNPSQGLVFSESINRIPGAPVTSGFDYLGNRSFVITYNLTLPPTLDAPTTYLMGFGMTTSSNIESIGVQIVADRDGFITEGPFDSLLGSNGQAGFISPLTDGVNNGFFASYLDLPASIPEPTTAGSLLGLAAGAMLSRQRRA